MKTKKYLLLLLSLSLVFIFAGCSNPLQMISGEVENSKSVNNTQPKNTPPDLGGSSAKQTAGETTQSPRKTVGTPSPTNTGQPKTDTAAPSPTGNVTGAIFSGQYINRPLKFSLPIPDDWNGVLTVEKGSWNSDADYTLDFLYTFPNSSIKQTIFSVFIFQKEISREEWDNDFPFWHFIDSKNGMTYAYGTPLEPSQEILDPSNSDKLELMQRMVNRDLPVMIQSFRILQE